MPGGADGVSGARTPVRSAINLVVAGQLGSRTRARRRVGLFRGRGEHVGEVDVGAAGQRDVGVLAVLGPGDHGQAGVHGPALGGVVGDRVTELGFAVVCVHEGAVGPAPLPRARVGVQRPAHDQAATGDGLDAEQVAVGQRPAGLSGLDAMVVAGADDQVAGAGLGAVGDADRGPGRDDAQLDEVVADAAGQFAAQRVVGGHQQDVGAVGGQRDVGGRGGVHHLLRLAADDPAVRSYSASTAVSPSRSRRLACCSQAARNRAGSGQPCVAEGAGEQGHAAAVLHGLELAGVPGQDDLGAAGLRVGDQFGQVQGGQHRGLIDDQQRARADGDRAAGAAPAGQVAQELGAVVTDRDSGGQGVAGGLGGVMPITGPSPAAAQIRAASASTRVFPDPAGALITDTRWPSVSADQRGSGLVRAQPGLRARRVRVLRTAGQCLFQCGGVGAERVRGLRAGQARRAARAGLRDSCALPGSAARGWRTARRRAAGRRCARRRAASCAGSATGSGASRQITGSNSDRSARSARSSSRAAAAAGSRPKRGSDPAQVLDHIGAGPGALFLLGQRDCLLRRARHLCAGSGPGVSGPRVCVPACPPPCHTDGATDASAHAESPRELVRPPCVDLRDIQRAVLRLCAS